MRNPYFREWSHAAQPAGNPNSIVWQSVPSAQAGVSAVEHGHAATGSSAQLPFAQYQELELQHPGQLHNNPQWSVNFLPINTHDTPFNDLRVRQALNYAINRAKLAQLYGGPAFATPSCQAIVPGLPGYRRYCPYTLHPRANGAWSAPDMARARQLVARSSTAGDRVDLVASPEGRRVHAGIRHPLHRQRPARARLPRSRSRTIPIAAITQKMWDSFQITSYGAWTPNYPDPSSYIPSFFACGGANANGYYCNPAIDREMQRAERLEPTNPSQSATVWERVDRQLTDSAEWVATVDTREVEITGPRVRNYEYSPVMGFLADQAWLSQPRRRRSNAT